MSVLGNLTKTFSGNLSKTINGNVTVTKIKRRMETFSGSFILDIVTFSFMVFLKSLKADTFWFSKRPAYVLAKTFLKPIVTFVKRFGSLNLTIPN